MTLEEFTRLENARPPIAPTRAGAPPLPTPKSSTELVVEERARAMEFLRHAIADAAPKGYDDADTRAWWDGKWGEGNSDRYMYNVDTYSDERKFNAEASDRDFRAWLGSYNAEMADKTRGLQLELKGATSAHDAAVQSNEAYLKSQAQQAESARQIGLARQRTFRSNLVGREAASAPVASNAPTFEMPSFGRSGIGSLRFSGAQPSDSAGAVLGGRFKNLSGAIKAG